MHTQSLKLKSQHNTIKMTNTYVLMPDDMGESLLMKELRNYGIAWTVESIEQGMGDERYVYLVSDWEDGLPNWQRFLDEFYYPDEAYIEVN